MEISVVIPTHKRPEFLRSALSSVAAQTRLDLVHEVIISENGNDDRSSKVCEEFSELPLRYLQRVPALDALCHFETLVRDANAPWVAWIGDDDMWSRYHLAEANRGLTANPDAVGFISACALVSNESRRIWGGEGLTFESSLWQGSDGVSDIEPWGLNRMYLESLVRAPVNPWGLVCRKQPLVVALQKWRQTSTAWDSDRLFMCLLAQHGMLAVGREIGLFYRRHPQNETSKQSSNPRTRERASGETTRMLIEEAKKSGIDLRLDWDRAWRAMTPVQREAYLYGSSLGACQALREVWGRAALELGVKQSPGSLVKAAGRMACPPVVWQALSEMRSRWLRT